MILRKLSVVLVLIVLLSFAQAKDECPLQCDCSSDFSVVRCRDMDKFPVFDFSSKVKTLDLTYGNIKHIHEKDVKAYTHLENLFISHNPLDCDHATTYTLKYVLKETAGLKSFDGHRIKCQGRVPLMPKKEHGRGDRRYKLGGGHHVHVYHGRTPYFSPLMMTGAIAITLLAVLSVAGVCLYLVHLRSKLHRAADALRKTEEGVGETPAQALMKGLRRQRKGTLGYPQNTIAESESEDEVNEKDYLKEKMKRQRRLSQGYADGSGSSADESVMVEINLNEDLYHPRKY